MDLGPLTGDDVDAAAQLLAAAFDDDPALVWWWPDRGLRTEMAPRLFAAQVRLALERGDGMMTAAGDAVGLYLPPGTEISEDDLVRCGLAELLGTYGAETAERMGGYLATADTLRAEVMPEPHWQLSYVGVHPRSRTKGLGTALVDEGTERARRDGVPAYLETRTQSNVAFCEQRGYRVVGETDVPDSLHLWGMRFG
jgi:ribosomal protein S18 acetylase RimI-like enzyme